MLLDDGEEVTKEVGDSVANQKTIWDDTYQRKQNIPAEINGVQNDFFSSQAGMRSCILRKLMNMHWLTKDREEKSF